MGFNRESNIEQDHHIEQDRLSEFCHMKPEDARLLLEIS